MALQNLLYTFIALGRLTEAIPTIAFPINSQVPPIARVAEPFSYTFSSSTFYSTLPLNYQLSAAPGWLSLNSNTRTLSGTPSSNDVGQENVTGVTIELTASDQTGSVTLNATIVISKNPSPVVEIPLSAQLSSFGDTFSSPSQLFYHPSTPFKFAFNLGTFSEDGRKPDLEYYAVTTDNTPLPSWIHFDSASLSFSGQTPDIASLIQPPQTFGIQLVASDVEGFCGSSIPFSIEVGVHLLAFKTSYMVMNTTAGADNTFSGLTNSLELDGQPADPTNISSIVADTPPWLHFDNSTLIISGHAPPDAISNNITLQAKDVFGNTANATVYVDIASDIFSGTVGVLNVTTGSPFSYNLGVYIRHLDDTSLAVQFSPALDWILFDPQTLILSGQVPENTQVADIDGTLNATSTATQTSKVQSFKLSIVPGSSQSPTPATTSTTSTINPTATAAPNESASHKSVSKGVIAGISILVTFMMLLLLVAFLCYRKRRQAARRHQSNPSKSEQSMPLDEKSNMADNIRTVSVLPPEPLPLDTSGFGDAASVYSVHLRNSTGANTVEGIKHSRTMSTTLMQPAQSNASGAIDFSDTSLFQNNNLGAEGGSTVASSGPISASAQILVRNYSRKGHARRSGRVWSTDCEENDSGTSAQSGDVAILNSKGASFSSTRMANFTTISPSIPEMPESESSTGGPTAMRAVRRNSRFMSHLDPNRSGTGHGSKQSISSLNMVAKRKSMGHGQDWPHGIYRDSKTWVTFNTGEGERKRQSCSSNKTDSSEMLGRHPPTNMSSNIVSPALTRVSASGLNARPISRRIVGASPFFHGRSTSRASKRRSAQKTRSSYADSPTVPEEVIMGQLEGSSSEVFQDENITSQSSIGVVYRSTRESTKQLRSYLHCQLQKSKTRSRTSMRSTESRDSRFESASPSIASLHRFQSTPRTEGFESGRTNAEDGYEEFLPDDYSEGSWETHQSAQGSQPNVITHGPAGSDEDTAVPEASSGGARNFVPLMKLDPKSPMLDIGSNARMVSGRGKKPVNVGTQMKGSVKARIECAGGEDDFTAYI
jgi:axial budding pattern protein 2